MDSQLLDSSKKYKLSTESELNGDFQYCRWLALLTLFLMTISLPTLVILNYYDVVAIDIPPLTWLVYIFIFNSVFLLILIKYMIRTVPYPLSSKIYNNQKKRAYN